MRFLTNPRVRILVFSTLILAAMLVLSAGLRHVSLAPGQPLPNFGDRAQEASGVVAPGDDGLLFILRIIYYIGLVIVPLLLLYMIFNPQARKQLLKDLIRLAIVLLVFLAVSNYLQRMRKLAQPPNQLGNPIAPQVTTSPSETMQFIANAPNWLVIGASLALAVMITLFLVGVLWFFLLRRGKLDTPLQRIAEEAQEAVEAIEAGGDLRDIIIRCYVEMSRVLSVKRGLNREKFMTPREFETALSGKGIPREPVEQLTRVFEQVRYGYRAPGKKEELKALDSLTAIVEACKVTG